MRIPVLIGFAAAVLCVDAVAQTEIQVAVGHSDTGAGFRFEHVPAPAVNDAATAAQFILVDGERDRNGGQLAALHDGRVPVEEDRPAENFFFRAGTDGGRIQIDLGSVISVKQVDSYSWHSDTRAPQVYKLYAADGTADGFKPEPKKDIDPGTCGWMLVASVDTRPQEGVGGGQHGVAISDSAGTIGKYRYLLFDIAPTEDRDSFGNTFFSEIDVIDADGPAPISVPVVEPILKTFETKDGKFHFTIDATAAPELADWSERELKPVVQQWYPKIVAMLPSEGYQAATKITLRFRNDMGGIPASAAGAGVNLNAPWFRGELDREALGAVVHELVHVAQSYPEFYRQRSRGATRNLAPNPSWLVEGIADYVRWFLYEPQSKGAEITRNNLREASYDSSYRITANFLNWVTEKHDKEIVRKLNTAAREGRYTEQLWKDWTGKSLQELGQEWKKFQEEQLKPGG